MITETEILDLGEILECPVLPYKGDKLFEHMLMASADRRLRFYYRKGSPHTLVTIIERERETTLNLFRDIESVKKLIDLIK